MNPTLRKAFDKLGFMPLVHAASPVLTLLNYREFRTLKRTANQLPLAPLRQRQPRFLYKYLSPYASRSFDRRTRLAVLTNHYQSLTVNANAAFFPALAQSPVLWRDTIDTNEFEISLSFPIQVDYEAELSLHFSINGTILQVVSFVIAPGAVAGATAPQVILFTQVQGLGNAEQMKLATKTLHDITPASLLIHAAYGLACAWGIACGAGVSTSGKAGTWVYRWFDYDAFWQDLKGEPGANAEIYVLPVPPPDRPLEEIRRNHRNRTLRKRAYKQQLREQVAHIWQVSFASATPVGLAVQPSFSGAKLPLPASASSVAVTSDDPSAALL